MRGELKSRRMIDKPSILKRLEISIREKLNVIPEVSSQEKEAAKKNLRVCTCLLFVTR